MKGTTVKDWIARLHAALTGRAKSLSRQVWSELPGHLTAAAVVEVAISGDLIWVAVAVFLLVVMAILRR